MNTNRSFTSIDGHRIDVAPIADDPTSPHVYLYASGKGTGSPGIFMQYSEDEARRMADRLIACADAVADAKAEREEAERKARIEPIMQANTVPLDAAYVRAQQLAGNNDTGYSVWPGTYNIAQALAEQGYKIMPVNG